MQSWEKSSQLLLFIKSLLGRRHMNESIMRLLWFNKLPQSMIHIPMAFSKEKTSSQLTELADRIADTYPQKSEVSKVSAENNKEDNAASHLCEICSKDNKGQSRHDFHWPAQSRNSSKGQSPAGNYLYYRWVSKIVIPVYGVSERGALCDWIY